MACMHNRGSCRAWMWMQIVCALHVVICLSPSQACHTSCLHGEAANGSHQEKSR